MNATRLGVLVVEGVVSCRGVIPKVGRIIRCLGPEILLKRRVFDRKGRDMAA